LSAATIHEAITPAPAAQLPSWLAEIVDLYNSHAGNQFILAGNIHDLFSIPGRDDLITLPELIQQLIVPRYNVVITYDIGNGLRVERGADIFGKWNERPEASSKSPRHAIQLITVYLRYVANLARLGQSRIKVAIILKDAPLFAGDGATDSEANALSFLIREWSREPLLTQHDTVSFVVTEGLSDLHPLIRQNVHAAQIHVPLPKPQQLEAILRQENYPLAMAELREDPAYAARQFAGSTLSSLLNLLKLKEYQKEPLRLEDLARTKAALIEKECPGLLEILPPKLNLSHLHGQQALKNHLRQNITLWREQRLDLIPMGYLICGPVGTGKTFLVRCLAGEANVPVVVLKNFRDRWYGSTESNLEKIFRTIKAIGQCYVFIDEADQSLGRRDSSGSEPAVSGRIYSMLAQEMSDKENRGRVVWLLATSRPDLVEVDLKRPGRIDVKIPLFPTTTAAEGFSLVQSLAQHHGFKLDHTAFAELERIIPDLLTAGEVEAFLTDLKREILLSKEPFLSVLKRRFADYIPAVPHSTLLSQIQLAVQECSKPEYIPERFRRAGERSFV
jgi:hypothetical protein